MPAGAPESREDNTGIVGETKKDDDMQTSNELVTLLSNFVEDLFTDLRAICNKRTESRSRFAALARRLRKEQKTKMKRRVRRPPTRRKPRAEFLEFATREFPQSVPGDGLFSVQEAMDILKAYIAREDLQDQQDKRLYRPDDELLKLFEGRQFNIGNGRQGYSYLTLQYQASPLLEPATAEQKRKRTATSSEETVLSDIEEEDDNENDADEDESACERDSNGSRQGNKRQRRIELEA